MDEVSFQKIPVEKIKPSPHQARTTFDDAELQQLAQSMKEEGLIQPIVARPITDGTFELIAGERRVRAAKLLGWTEINARVFPNTNDQDAALKGLIENLQRKDLNPIEEARGYKQLTELPFNLSHDEVAQKLGITNKQNVSRAIAMLDMPQEIQDLVPRGTISERHARAIRQIPDKTKQIALAQQADKEGWSVKQTEEAVNKVVDPKGEKKAAKGDGKSKKEEKDDIPDPLAAVWLQIKAAHQLPPELWRVDYGDKKLFGDKASALPGWNVWVTHQTHAPEDSMVKVLQVLLKALGVTAQPTPVVQAPPAPKPMPPKAKTVMAPARVAVPIPEPQEATFVSGDRMQIKWADLGPGFTYQVMWAPDPERPNFRLLQEDARVKTAGAIVNVYSNGESRQVLIAVQAIDPEGHLSEISQPVGFDLKPWNKEYSVLPLPVNVMKPTVVAAVAPTPVSAEAVPPTQPKKPLDPRIAALLATHEGKERVS